MPDGVTRLIYFFTHPSEYSGLWTLDLSVATFLLAVGTLWVVLRQLTLMKHQDDLMQRQTDIVVRQDVTNREILSRRSKLMMYVEPAGPSQVVILCRNDGNKTAQNFYWHLSVPSTVSGNPVWNASGNEMLPNTGTDVHEGESYRHYNGLIPDPLYPTRVTPVARIMTTDRKLALWWSTVSEDGSHPTSDGKMQRMEESVSGGP
jgi:hypothetical protein